MRDAVRGDVGAITDIYNQAVRHTTASWDLEPVSLQSRLDWYDTKIAGNWPVLVAEEAGAVVGWASFSQFRDKPGYRHSVEHSLYVRQDHQGRGVGSRLLTALVVEARRRGLHTMVGGVSGDNPGSIAFHEKHGFAVVARFPQVGRKFDRWLDLVFLQLLLD